MVCGCGLVGPGARFAGARGAVCFCLVGLVVLGEGYSKLPWQLLACWNMGCKTRRHGGLTSGGNPAKSCFSV